MTFHHKSKKMARPGVIVSAVHVDLLQLDLQVSKEDCLNFLTRSFIFKMRRFVKPRVHARLGLVRRGHTRSPRARLVGKRPRARAHTIASPPDR